MGAAGARRLALAAWGAITRRHDLGHLGRMGVAALATATMAAALHVLKIVGRRPYLLLDLRARPCAPRCGRTLPCPAGPGAFPAVRFAPEPVSADYRRGLWPLPHLHQSARRSWHGLAIVALGIGLG